MSPRHCLLLVPALLVTLAACGDDDDDAGATSTVPATAAAATTPPMPPTTAATDGADADGTLVEDACALVPTDAVAAATGAEVGPASPDGNELRRVCVFTLDGSGVTVGVEAADRFEDKAATSRRSLEVDGEEVTGLGDRALFFFSDDDIPEGVGGTLVGVGAVTIDVTLQGMDEAALREASIGIAEVAVSNL